MNKILMSIKPQWCSKIFDGEKMIELRKTRPNISPPFEVFVYQTKIRFKVRDWQENFQSMVFTPNGGAENGNGKVIGSFVCDRIIEMKYNFCDHPEIGYLPGQDCGDSWWEWNDEDDKTCLTSEELTAYAGGRHILYGWHITEPKLFDKPKELSEFMLGNGWIAGRFPVKRAPQSWMYVEEM